MPNDTTEPNEMQPFSDQPQEQGEDQLLIAAIEEIDQKIDELTQRIEALEAGEAGENDSEESPKESATTLSSFMDEIRSFFKSKDDVLAKQDQKIDSIKKEIENALNG